MNLQQDDFDKDDILSEVISKNEDDKTLSEKTKQTKKSGNIIKLVLFIIVILAFVYYADNAGFFDKFKKGHLVAKVNNEAITKKDLDQRINLFKVQLQGAGADFSEDDIKAQALDSLINDKLLVQKARENGYVVSDDDVSSEIESIIAQLGGKAEFKNQLLKEGLTEKELRTGIKNRMLVQKYISDNIDLESENASLTEEEIKSFYDDFFGSQQNPPSYEDVKDQIKNQLLNQKRRDKINAFVSSLRDEAKIEIINNN